MRTWLVGLAICALTFSCSDSEETLGTGGMGAGAQGGGGTTMTTTTTGAGGTPPPPMCDPVDYSDTSLFTVSPVSFAADVMPILQNSCTGNGSNCHSTADPTPSGGLPLAPPSGTTPTQTQIDASHAEMVGVASSRSSLELVTPSDLVASFFLIKLEYPSPGICLPDGATCTPGCGSDMPAGNSTPPLTDAEMAVVRTWIRDGALND